RLQGRLCPARPLLPHLQTRPGIGPWHLGCDHPVTTVDGRPDLVAQPETSAGMTQWEFSRVRAPTNTGQEFIDALNRFGSDGWEMVALTAADKTIGLNALIAVMKRECVRPHSPPTPDAEWHDDPTGRFD